MLLRYGKTNAVAIAVAFDKLLNEIVAITGNSGREVSIVKTKLEEACFFAKKAMANDPINNVEA